MLHEYFKFFSSMMAAEAAVIRDFYRQHPGKHGEADELVLQRFLSSCLPKKFSIGSGFALFTDSSISTEQDIVIYDALHNPVFFPEFRSAIFPPSAIHALIEVKATLDASRLQSIVKKTEKVKQEIRNIASVVLDNRPVLLEPLVCAFSYGGLDIVNAKKKLVDFQRDIAEVDRLDFLCLLNEGLIVGGTYFNVSVFGEPNSPHARNITPGKRSEIEAIYPDRVKAYRFRENSLLVFYYWFLSYLIRRPIVVPDLAAYFPTEYVWGEEC